MENIYLALKNMMPVMIELDFSVLKISITYADSHNYEKINSDWFRWWFASRRNMDFT